MEKFMNLPQEKRNTIINAAMYVFGANGYKKASVGDIAKAAGISKPLIFHYFGTKQALYFFLIDVSIEIISEEMNKKADPGITDFFEKLKIRSDIKVAAMKKHPALFSFIKSYYFENSEEIKAELKSHLAGSMDHSIKPFTEGVDAYKFKDGIDPDTVLRVLILIDEGIVSELPEFKNADFDKVAEEFYIYMNLIKNNFYKPEYLNK